jgi:hypothetical protein
MIRKICIASDVFFPFVFMSLQVARDLLGKEAKLRQDARFTMALRRSE